MVCGLALEAALIPASGPWRALCLGPGPAAAEQAAHRLLDEGCAALLSFGTAGGLDPALAPGTLVLARAVIADQEDGSLVPPYRPDDTLSAALCGRGSGVHEGTVVGVSHPVTSPEAKARLARRTGACIVDMESHAVARVAQARGVPFAVLRAVADPATRSVPAWAVAGVDALGRTRAGAVLAAVAVRPDRWADLVALARDAGAAKRALRGVWRGEG